MQKLNVVKTRAEEDEEKSLQLDGRLAADEKGARAYDRIAKREGSSIR